MADGTCSIEGCDRPSNGRRMCSTHYRRFALYGQADRPNLICTTCGQEFPKANKGGPDPRFCSDACDPKKPRMRVPCALCGTEFDRKTARQRFCTPRCQCRAFRNGGKLPERDCVYCGKRLDFTIIRPGGRRYSVNAVSCFDCRRDQRYELTVQQLAERDGTDCSLCGDPVDMTLKWPHRMAPTRDHVIPVTHGGSNAADNLRLAHFSCNCRKGNRVRNAS